MNKNNDVSVVESLNVGIVGHIDHGKTTLLQRLTGVWASRHSEELKRGITIKLGYADTLIYLDNGVYNIEKKGDLVKHVSFVDAPGHEMLMATMLSGAAMMDAAILVVAANEGIKPQTREHFMALQAKGINQIIVVQNKIDLCDKETAKKNYLDIKKLLGEEYSNIPIIPVSAQQGVNIPLVLEKIVEMKKVERDENLKPIFLIARSFDVNKPGTIPEKLSGAVLGGTLKQGILSVGDKIEIKPGRILKEGNQTRYETVVSEISALYLGSNKVDKLTPGGSASIETELDMSVAKSDALGGNVLSLNGELPELSNNVKIKFNLFEDSFSKEKFKGITPGETLMVSVNTSISGGMVKTVKKDEFEIDLKVPIVPFEGDSVGIARNVNGHWRLIGYGKVI